MENMQLKQPISRFQLQNGENNYRYGGYQIIEEEVGDMLKTLYDPKIFEAGKLEGKREGEMNIITSMIREGLNDAFIARVSKMPVEEIRAIRQSK